MKTSKLPITGHLCCEGAWPRLSAAMGNDVEMGLIVFYHYDHSGNGQKTTVISRKYAKQGCHLLFICDECLRCM